jgi:Flp pilus assembly protein TadG
VWKHLAHQLRIEQGGSILVVVAIALTAIFGLTALGTDVGRLYVERQHLSAVADTAALAGAQKLPGDPAGAAASAVDYIEKNGYPASSATIALSESNQRISVNLSSAVAMTFARVIGHSVEPVDGGATAKVSKLSGYLGAVPLGVPRASWQFGEQVTLKLDADSGTISPGNYGALALGKSGASMYEANLSNGYNSWIRADDWLDAETGNMATPTVRAVNYRIGLDPYVTYSTATRQSPRLVVIPILEDFTINGRGQVHVVGFGMFFLEKAEDQGNDKGEIVGRFVRMMTEGESADTAPDFGLYTVKLVQ